MTSKGLCLQMLVLQSTSQQQQYLAPLDYIRADTQEVLALIFHGWNSTLRRKPDLTLLNSS